MQEWMGSFKGYELTGIAGVLIQGILSAVQMHVAVNKGLNCRCAENYEGEACESIIEDPLDRTNATHQLTHVKIMLWGEFDESSRLEAYWKLSLRESTRFEVE